MPQPVIRFLTNDDLVWIVEQFISDLNIATVKAKDQIGPYLVHKTLLEIEFRAGSNIVQIGYQFLISWAWVPLIVEDAKTNERRPCLFRGLLSYSFCIKIVL